jgi:chromosome segregation ATPase
MISGRQALAQIEQVIEKARQQEAKCELAYTRATEEIGRLRIQRTEAFRELARLKLDAIRQEQVVGHLDAAERQALSVLTSRQEALRQLTERRRQAEERVRQAEGQRQTAVDALERALAQIEALRRDVEAEVSTDPEWAAARARVAEITGQAQQAEKKAVQAETDRDEKRRPYEADPLFMYLWKRKFGTAAYRTSPFTRYMDRLVARVVGYDKARTNYALLNEIPERLREHARRIIDDLRTVRSQLTALERQALVAAGIPPLEEKAAQGKEAVEEAERRLAEARSALSDLDRTHDASVLEGDALYREAVAVLAAADEREDLNQLYEEALRTPTPQDEAIVRRIQATDVMINRALRQAADAHRQLKETAQRRAMIEQEWDELRSQGYDTPYGTFGNEAALSNVLGGVLTGAIGGAILGQVLRGGFHHGPSPWDSGFGGGIPFPQPGGFGTGGSFGGGGFRTGGSF